MRTCTVQYVYLVGADGEEAGLVHEAERVAHELRVGKLGAALVHAAREPEHRVLVRPDRPVLVRRAWRLAEEGVAAREIRARVRERRGRQRLAAQQRRAHPLQRR